MTEMLSLDDIGALARDCLTRAGLAPGRAEAVAREVTLCEAAGDRANGLDALLRDLRLMRYGRIDPHGDPALSRNHTAILSLDAGHGFAAAALVEAHASLTAATRAAGLILLRLTQASDPGAMAAAMRDLAEDGLIALGVTPDGILRLARPDHPAPACFGGPAQSALETLLGIADAAGAPPDTPLAGPVAHQAWLAAALPGVTGLETLAAEHVFDPPAVARHSVALPPDLLAQIVTA